MATSLTHLPEHAIAAYAQERASVQRMILEARWANLQRDDTYEHPDTYRDDQLHRIRRAHLVHLGALYDVLALRGARDTEVHDTARGLGTELLAHDGFHLPTTRGSGINHLRTTYADLHHHAGPRPRAALPPPAADQQAEPAALPGRYPTESRLVSDVLRSYAVAKACQNDGLTTDAYAQMRRHHMARGLLLWKASALAPADRAAAQAAAQAGHHVRKLDGHPRTTEENARQYLLEAYLEVLGERDEDDQLHEPDCPGGCGGDGIVMATLTWDDQGDGIFVPVWAEPIDCTAGVPQEHDRDCPECHGHGYTYSRGERHLCCCLQPVDLTA
ncbi:hypothetical protein ACFYO5_34275 [Streptomyces sp. NPDC006259]|uniref:hypothetical protein n=1 Tax=Streptomyces sp. NPDC006259 TaxID=3364740 RepID=UPI00367C996F